MITAGALIMLVAGSVWVFVRVGSGGWLDDSLRLGAGAAGVKEPQPVRVIANEAKHDGRTGSAMPGREQVAKSDEEAKAPPAPVSLSPDMPPDSTPSKPETTTETSASNDQAATTTSTTALLETAKSASERGDWLAARNAYSRLWRMDLDPATRAMVREKAEQVAMDTILGPRIVPGDPLVDRYVVDAGDLLAKIASANKVPVGVLVRINGLSDPNRIQIGQTLKVLKGPFHAVVDKSNFTLDVYLGDTFVRRFKVGLGADDSTPTGEWQVSTKLKNPTYYPPRGGPIISADDPKNPLGEHWIGLRGISGEALGQERYGIHGTIEPDTIGRNASLGCVRLLNEDVEQLYSYLIEQHSRVTVVAGG